MKLDKSHIKGGIVGATIGACSVIGINALSDHNNSTSISFYDTSSLSGKASMFDNVEADVNGDVFITPNGKKYHRRDCYIIRRSQERKKASRSNVINAGYKACKKCKP